MKTVILCGGKGIRIRDLSQELPKPLIPIGDLPILCHIMNIYSRNGLNDFVLCLGYKSWKIKEYFLNYKYQTGDFSLTLGEDKPPRLHNDDRSLRWNITFAETGIESMTGSRLKRVERYAGRETFMLTYGDGVGDIDIRKLLEFHQAHGKLVTVTSVRPTSRFGELEADADGKVVSFHEKTQTSKGLINGGFFVCNPGVFEYISEDPTCMFETEPLQQLAREDELMTYVHTGFWQPMDTTREYLLLNRLWRKGDAPWTQ